MQVGMLAQASDTIVASPPPQLPVHPLLESSTPSPFPSFPHPLLSTFPHHTYTPHSLTPHSDTSSYMYCCDTTPFAAPYSVGSSTQRNSKLNSGQKRTLPTAPQDPLETDFGDPLSLEEGLEPGGRRGLSLLVQKEMGKPLDKSEQLSDWERRPLRLTQVKYAGSV